MKRMKYILIALCMAGLAAQAQNDNVLDEVAWIVGDEPILKSDIEMQRLAAEYNRTPIEGDPYVVIPEEIAIQKLFLHQAELDSIDVSEADVSSYVDAEVQRQVSIAGSAQPDAFLLVELDARAALDYELFGAAGLYVKSGRQDKSRPEALFL